MDGRHGRADERTTETTTAGPLPEPTHGAFYSRASAMLALRSQITVVGTASDVLSYLSFLYKLLLGPFHEPLAAAGSCNHAVVCWFSSCTLLDVLCWSDFSQARVTFEGLVLGVLDQIHLPVPCCTSKYQLHYNPDFSVKENIVCIIFLFSF